MIERIDQIQGEAVIGKMYRVLCVNVNDGHRYAAYIRNGWLPVVGTAHDDTEIIGVSGRHYHIDWRFTKMGDIGEFESARKFGRVIWERNVIGKPLFMRRKLLRQMDEFPIRIPNFGGGSSPIVFIPRLEAAYRDVKLKQNCMLCPHRGISLAGVPEKDGVRVCPGHGLAWRISDGAMVPRATK